MYNVYEVVAPLVGAWIEIPEEAASRRERSLSLPSWERGLKFVAVLPNTAVTPSLPSWERGLK